MADQILGATLKEGAILAVEAGPRREARLEELIGQQLGGHQGLRNLLLKYLFGFGVGKQNLGAIRTINTNPSMLDWKAKTLRLTQRILEATLAERATLLEEATLVERATPVERVRLTEKAKIIGLQIRDLQAFTRFNTKILGWIRD